MRFSKEVIGECQLFLAAILFGFAFVGSRQATTDVAGPFTFNAWRFAISTVLLLILRSPLQSILKSDINGKLAREPEEVGIMVQIKSWLPSHLSEATFDLYFWGILCGIANFSLTTFIQYGLLTVPAGKAAFINGLFVVVTPFAELLLPGAKYHISYKIWISVCLSVVGTYLLSDADSVTIGFGEILLLCATFATVVNILAADAGSKRVDCVDLTCVEFATSCVLSSLPSLYFEFHLWTSFDAFRQGWQMIVFVAIVEGAAFLISTVGQMYSTSSARSALIFSLESVFTAILGYLLLGEALTKPEIVGCTLMFAATVISSGTLDDEGAEEMDQVTARSLDNTMNTSIENGDIELSVNSTTTPLIQSQLAGKSYGTK